MSQKSKYKIVAGKKIPRSKKKRRNFMEKFNKQTSKPIMFNDALVFGKYKGKRVSVIEQIDPQYFRWLTITFEIRRPIC